MGVGFQGQPAWDDNEVLEDIVRQLSQHNDDNWEKWAAEKFEPGERDAQPGSKHAQIVGKTNREILKNLCPPGNLIRLYWIQDGRQEVGACEWEGDDLDCSGFEASLADMEVTCEKPGSELGKLETPFELLRHLHPDDFGY